MQPRSLYCSPVPLTSVFSFSECASLASAFRTRVVFPSCCVASYSSLGSSPSGEFFFPSLSSCFLVRFLPFSARPACQDFCCCGGGFPFWSSGQRLLVCLLPPRCPEVLQRALLASPSSLRPPFSIGSELAPFLAFSVTLSLRSLQARVVLASLTVCLPHCLRCSPALLVSPPRSPCGFFSTVPRLLLLLGLL